MTKTKEQELKKFDLNSEKRLKTIRMMALEMQDIQMKKTSEFRQYAESIEVLANTKLLIQLNDSLEDIKKGDYIVLTKDKK